MVSQGAIASMIISGVIAFLLPIGLMIWFRRKYHAPIKVFLLALLRFLFLLSCWRAAFMFMCCK